MSCLSGVSARLILTGVEESETVSLGTTTLQCFTLAVAAPASFPEGRPSDAFLAEAEEPVTNLSGTRRCRGLPAHRSTTTIRRRVLDCARYFSNFADACEYSATTIFTLCADVVFHESGGSRQRVVTS